MLNILEEHVCIDRVHMLIEIPSKSNNRIVFQAMALAGQAGDVEAGPSFASGRQAIFIRQWGIVQMASGSHWLLVKF